MVLVLGNKGMFVSGQLITTVQYVPGCCNFSQQSFTSAGLEIALVLLSTALLGLFVVLWFRSVKDSMRHLRCNRRNKQPSIDFVLNGIGDGDSVALNDDGTGANTAEERQELADIEQRAGRLNRSDSVTSTGSFVARSRRQEFRYKLHVCCRRVRACRSDVGGSEVLFD